MSFHQNTQKWRLNIWNRNGKKFLEVISHHFLSQYFIKLICFTKLARILSCVSVPKKVPCFSNSGLPNWFSACSMKSVRFLLWQCFTQILAAGDNKYLLNDYRFAAHQCGGEPSSGGWLCHLSSLQLVMNEECPWGGQFKHEFCTVFLRFQGFAPHSQED